MIYQKAFSVAEANRTIPILENVLACIDAKKAQVQQCHEKLQVLEVMWGDLVGAKTNPDHLEYLRYWQALEVMAQELDHLVRHEILGRGLRFPSGGVEHGLVDFPTFYAGRWVFLCWQRGEEQLRFWHETDEGYQGRQELTPEQLLGMGHQDPPEPLEELHRL
jgi:hypothetical protein